MYVVCIYCNRSYICIYLYDCILNVCNMPYISICMIMYSIYISYMVYGEDTSPSRSCARSTAGSWAPV